MPDHCFPFQERLNCIGTLCVLRIWWCAYTSPWVFTVWRIHQTCSLHSQTDYCFERTSEGPQSLHSPAISINSIFQNNNIYLSCSFICFTIPLYGIWTALWQPLQQPKVPKMLFELRFISWFLHSGNSPKIHKMCVHKLWTTIIVSCLDVDEDGWCNSLCKYETKIPAGNRTADPLSCVLASKYDDLNTVDQTFL